MIGSQRKGLIVCIQGLKESSQYLIILPLIAQYRKWVCGVDMTMICRDHQHLRSVLGNVKGVDSRKSVIISGRWNTIERWAGNYETKRIDFILIE